MFRGEMQTTSVVAAEVKAAQSRPQRRRRSYLGVDNNSKVFDITEAAPVDMCFVVTPDLYDVGFANVATGKNEDLYKIPPELLRKSKRTVSLSIILYLFCCC